MEIIPAIDLRNGKCVRLYQGDYNQETVFSDNPAAMAIRWQSEGAKRLHLVDLDGAAKGEPCNLKAVQDILKAVAIPVELGGGVRNLETINKMLELGVGRVILGTLAIEDPDLAKEAFKEFGKYIVIGIDAREGTVATRGWLEKSAVSAVKLAKQMVDLGAKRIIYTDISRDGTLTSPNFKALGEIISQVNVPVIAAGGISSVKHLTKLAAIGAEGAIVGRAIYTGDVKLEKALKETADK